MFVKTPGEILVTHVYYDKRRCGSMGPQTNKKNREKIIERPDADVCTR